MDEAMTRPVSCSQALDSLSVSSAAGRPMSIQDEAAPPPPGRIPIRRVVLLGYMCSGKSTVGAALARRLEWSYLDFDVEIEHREGRTVKEVVESGGEERFRALEAVLTEEAAGAAGAVLAPGGGWITRPEMLDVLGPDTLSVWLRVSAVETVRRLREDSIDRPFREDPDALARVAEMLAGREPLYRLADLTVPVDLRRPEEIAFEIEQVVRTRAAFA
jgi:shikimate kinase